MEDQLRRVARALVFSSDAICYPLHCLVALSHFALSLTATVEQPHVTQCIMTVASVLGVEHEQLYQETSVVPGQSLACPAVLYNDGAQVSTSRCAALHMFSPRSRTFTNNDLGVCSLREALVAELPKHHETPTVLLAGATRRGSVEV